MDVSTLFGGLGFLLASILSIIGGVVWTNKRYEDLREQQIEDDKVVKKDVEEYINRLKSERDLVIKELTTTISNIKDSAATRQEVSLTETRLTNAINDLKTETRKQFERIEDKLSRVPEMAATMQSLDRMLRSAIGKDGND